MGSFFMTNKNLGPELGPCIWASPRGRVVHSQSIIELGVLLTCHEIKRLQLDTTSNFWIVHPSIDTVVCFNNTPLQN
jgi:hypothetical protein